MTDNVIVEDKSLPQMILEEVEEQGPETFRKSGLILSVGTKWLIRLWWVLEEEPEVFPLRELVNSRPELLENLYRAQGTREIVRACMELASYTYPRGYDVGLRGTSRWEMFKLDLFNLIGGFTRANRA